MPGQLIARGPAFGFGLHPLELTRDQADVVARSTHRISELVGAVKTYTFMDRATEQEVDVHDGIENTLVILAHRLKDATIQRDFDRNLPPVRARGSGLNQVWTNVIDNAVDATGGTGTISIRTSRDGDRAVVEIAGRAGVDVPQTRVVHELVTALGDLGGPSAAR